MDEGDMEDIHNYEICEAVDETVMDEEEQQVQARDAEIEERVFVMNSLRANGEIHHDKLAVERFRHMQLLPQRIRVIEQRWAQLYDKKEHYRLQHAIAKELDEGRTTQT